MFWAIHKHTKQRINSIAKEFSVEFMKDEEWYADPLEIEECPENISINNIDVKYRKKSEEIINEYGTIYDISPHFFIPNASKLGIKSKPFSEEHTKAVKILYELLRSNKLKIIYSTQNKPTQTENEIVINNEMFDFLRLDIEVTIKNKNIKRADVLLPLKEYHPLLGFGIVFEIQLTKQSEKVEIERTFDRASKGYSVCWLYHHDFDDQMHYLKESIFIASIDTILKEYRNYSENKIKELTINYTKLIHDKINELYHLSQKINAPDVIICSFNCNGSMFKRDGKFGEYYHCYNCSKNISIGVKKHEKN